MEKRGDLEGQSDFCAPEIPRKNSEMLESATTFDNNRSLIVGKEPDAVAVAQDEIATIESDLVKTEIEDKLRENLLYVRDRLGSLLEQIVEKENKFRMPGFGERRKKELVLLVQEETKKLKGVLNGFGGYDDAVLRTFDVHKRPDSEFPRSYLGRANKHSTTVQEKLFELDGRVKDALYSLETLDNVGKEGHIYERAKDQIRYIVGLVNEVL